MSNKILRTIIYTVLISALLISMIVRQQRRSAHEGRSSAVPTITLPDTAS